MKSQYDKIVRLICGDNWNSEQIPVEEKDGGYGVAMCLACLQRVPARINDLSEALGCSPYILEIPYRRLQINGVFSANSPILNDPDLMMNRAKSDEDYERAIRAWCHIAGLASGFVGKASNRVEAVTNRKGK